MFSNRKFSRFNDSQTQEQIAASGLGKGNSTHLGKLQNPSVIINTEVEETAVEE